MMTHKEARKFLKRLSYKPDTKFRIQRGHAYHGIPRSKPVFMITQYGIEDSCGGNVSGLRSWTTLPGGPKYIHMTEKELLAKVQKMAKDHEMHEMHEWFKIDEVPLYNPHTGKRAHV